jgi:hypothetical protein
LIAAYVFLLQAFLASLALTQAVAADAIGSDANFVICSSDSHASGGPANADLNHLSKCCLVCTLAHSTVTAIPIAVATAAWVGAAVASIRADGGPSVGLVPFRGVRSGPSRAPPRTA